MGATSVTGVGLGSADKKNKGSEHLSLSANKIIGPRIVMAGTFVLDGSGNGTLNLPLLADAVDTTSTFAIVATDTNTSSAAAVGASLSIGASNTTVTFKGTASHTVQYIIFKNGIAV